MTSHEEWVSGRTCVHNIGYHIVWSTKYRRKFIEGEIEKRLKALFIAIAGEFEFDFKEMEVMPDHCHAFVSCHPKKAPSDIVKCLKGITARKLLLEFPVIRKKLWGGHLWNPSYYIGTVGNMSKDVVLRYIQQQKTEGTGSKLPRMIDTQPYIPSLKRGGFRLLILKHLAKRSQP